ncbi:MAG TPA: ATP phosphoribosyltransferase regulatory subunit, partial [Pyrinomonadaceae bacterium]
HRAALQSLRDPGAHLAAVDQLNEIVELAKQTPAAGRIRFDPSLARGLSYYTGAIMEIAVPDLAGSLGGGGRYDNLIGMFLGKDVPACGFSLGLERIIVVMSEREMFPPRISESGADIMVVLTEPESLISLELASYLRFRKLSTFLYPQADKPEKQRSYADKQKIPFIVWTENGDSVYLRNLLDRKTEFVSKEIAAETVLAWKQYREKTLPLEKDFELKWKDNA